MAATAEEGLAMRVRLFAIMVTALVAGACGSPATESAPASEAAAAATVAVSDSDLGPILVDGEGRTLYLLTGDEQGASTCSDDCAATWPPLAGPAEAGDGADTALIGEVERDDGSTQATYNDWPLYYFADDAQAGDINGQGVGDVWFVLDASGEPVKEAAGDVEQPRDY